MDVKHPRSYNVNKQLQEQQIQEAPTEIKKHKKKKIRDSLNILCNFFSCVRTAWCSPSRCGR